MIPSTYLLYSDNRVNLKKRAEEFAKVIFKKNELEYFSQDVVYYDEIKIDAVRQIISKSSESSYSGLKIFILNMENIRLEASNALLKVIEEPSKNTYFLLISKKIDSLPKTILSRSIKKYIESKKYKISDEIYELFDGENEYLDEYIQKNINISDYIIKDPMQIPLYIEEYLNSSDDILSKIKYELSIDYIINKLKFIDYKTKLFLIQNLCDMLSNNRNISRIFLTRILVKCKMKINAKTYMYLTNLKNSLKNNVSCYSCIYIFLNELIGG